jgi:AhpC/TSA family
VATDIGTIEPGQHAPDFELPEHTGRTVKLSDFEGQPVVIHFSRRPTRRVAKTVKAMAGFTLGLGTTGSVLAP